MGFNDTFNIISDIMRRSVLLVEESGVPGENHRPATSHWHSFFDLKIYGESNKYLANWPHKI